MKIQNHTFIVTGGASGLGLATAQMLVENGAKVGILDTNEAVGTAVQASLGSESLFVKTDVTSEQEVQKAIDEIKNTFGAIHGVINCAGMGPAQRVVGRENVVHSLAFFQKIIDVNLIGTFNVLRLVANEMQHTIATDPDGERGIIINTASVAAFDGQVGQAAYAASKGGIVSMTLPIARELAKLGIRVMAIAPGIFETPLLAAYSQEVKDSLGKQVPFPPRLGKPSEYAFMVKHIIENTMLNGEVIRLDGAIRMNAK